MCFLTAPEAGIPISRCWPIQFLERFLARALFLAGRWLLSCVRAHRPPTHTHTHIHRERETSLESLLLRALISLGEGPNSMTSSDPTYLPETPSPIPAHWGLGLPHEFGGKHKGSVCNTNDTGIDSQDPPSILGPVTS